MMVMYSRCLVASYFIDCIIRAQLFKASLGVIMLTVLVSTISNSQVFLLKNVSSFCKCKTYPHFFSKNISIYPYLMIKFLTKR